MKLTNKLIAFIKNETVLCIALLLALISSFFVRPFYQGFKYIDFRTLAILFSLMCVMAGLQKMLVFQAIAQKLLSKVHNYFSLILILVFLCFFFSMFITNDVALITFVPFTFVIIKMINNSLDTKLIIKIIVLQTIAANLGSMLTPIGNPQNLYLYELAKLSFIDFFILMGPYVLLAMFLLFICCFVILKKNELYKTQVQVSLSQNIQFDYKIFVYIVLFIICLLTVSRIIPYYIMLLIVFATLIFVDKKILLQVDYSLLFTFVVFFIFIGNISNIRFFNQFIVKVLEAREVLVSVLLSQIISNVPASLLLSGFTNKYSLLIIGTNLGGLGTLIASMASLISYKLYAKEVPTQKGKYLLLFTLFNLLFLVFEVLLLILIKL